MSDIENKEPGFPSDKIRVWEKIIDVQKHFNDVKSKNQTLFISVVTASLIASGYLYSVQGHETFNFPLRVVDISILVYTIPLLGSAFFTLAFYILDFGIYHTLLKGAVKAGQEFEKNYIKADLTSIIIEKYSEEHKLFGFLEGAGVKLTWFYTIIGLGLVALFLVLNICHLLQKPSANENNQQKGIQQVIEDLERLK